MHLRTILPCLLSLACLGLTAAEGDADAEKAALKATVANANAKVEEDLGSPDGATIRYLPGNAWQIFGQGTATYDLPDNDEVQRAKTEAMMRAKANIAKFLKESISSKEKIDEITMKSKSLAATADQVTDNSVSVESVKVTTTTLASKSDAVLRGVVVLEMKRTPTGTNSGIITIRVGVSSRSQALAGAAGADMAKPSAGSGQGGTGNGSTAPNPGAGLPANTAEHQTSQTDL